MKWKTENIFMVKWINIWKIFILKCFYKWKKKPGAWTHPLNNDLPKSLSGLGKGRQLLEILGQGSFHTCSTAFPSVINRFIKSFLSSALC